MVSTSMSFSKAAAEMCMLGCSESQGYLVMQEQYLYGPRTVIYLHGLPTSVGKTEIDR